MTTSVQKVAWRPALSDSHDFDAERLDSGRDDADQSRIDRHDAGDLPPRNRTPSASRLSALLRRRRFIGCDDILFRSVTDEVGDCRPGDLFVARETADRDGHELISEAVSRGASGIVAERMIPTFGVPLCIVPNATSALSRVAEALAGHPSRRLRVIAVTGTSGKTTTAWLTASILAEAGIAVGVLSDIGCLDGESSMPVPAGRGDRPLDRPLVVSRWLRRLVLTGCTHAVLEVSRRMLTGGGLSGVRCDTVGITNLATSRSDAQGTREARERLKARVIGRLARKGRAVVNADDPRLRGFTGDRGGVFVGLSGHATAVCGSTVDRSLHGQTLLLQEGGTVCPVDLSPPLASFARNALVAAGIAKRYGVGLTTVTRGLEAAGCVSGRLERCSFGQEFTAFVDSPGCGHQLTATLTGLRELTPGRLACVVSGRLAGQLSTEGCIGGGLPPLLRRWCDEAIVVPEDQQGPEALARFARLMDSLGEKDCLIMLDRRAIQPEPTDPSGESMPLALLLEAWVESSSIAESFRKGRAA